MARLLRGIAEGFQRLKDNLFPEPYETDPDRPHDLYVSNVVRRTLAHIIARTDVGDVPIRALTNGRLLVQSTQALGNALDTWEGTASDSWDQHQFPGETMGIMVAAETNDLNVAFSVDGSNWSDTATIKAGESATFNLAVNYVRVRNASAGNNAGYRVWAEYYSG